MSDDAERGAYRYYYISMRSIEELTMALTLQPAGDKESGCEAASPISASVI